jgi:hypothetical protein
MTALPSRTRANRANALHSTGPRTPAGLARSSQNALKVGLFSRLAVLPALGESAEEYDAFRAAVVDDLAPAGAGTVEAELADRVAVVMWRLRRVVRYEAAAMTAATGTLPPHTDAVAPVSGHPYYLPVPPDAPTAYRLGRLRGTLASNVNHLDRLRAAAAVLDPDLDPHTPVDGMTADEVLDVVGRERKWKTWPYDWTGVQETEIRIRRGVQRPVDRGPAPECAARGGRHDQAEPGGIPGGRPGADARGCRRVRARDRGPAPGGGRAGGPVAPGT